MIRIYMVRHGRTTWNKIGKYQGSTDVPLSETGIEQAEKAASHLTGLKIDGFYTSPLSRARTTCEIIAKPHGMKPVILPGLSELNFGEWEGKTFDEINTLWPGEIDKMYDSPDLVRIPGGETFEEVKERTMAAIEPLLNGEDNKNYLLVSHGAAIRTLLCGLLNIPIHHAWQFRQANVNLTMVEHYGPGRNWLAKLNETAYLEV